MNDDREIKLSVIASDEPIQIARLSQLQRHIRRRIVAVHEAGHATLGVRFGLTFDHVEMIDEYNGLVSGIEDLKERPLDWLIMGAAGLAAELLYLRLTNQQHLESDAWTGAEFDSGVIASYAGKAGVQVPEIRRRANELVVANWTEILSMSRRLDKGGKVGYRPARAASGASETLRPTPLPYQ